jgi:hypothetical protein
MTEGYIYCFSNPSMPGLVKVGMTERTPLDRLNESNISNTWIPSKFKIEFAKKCSNPKEKEKMIHILLSKYEDRVNPAREFFKTTSEEVKLFFDLIDGDYWNMESYKTTPIPSMNIGSQSPLKCETIKSKKRPNNLNRPYDLSECFKRDTELRFRKSAIKGTVEYATYYVSESKIIGEDGNNYDTFNKWATTCNKGQKYCAYKTFYKNNIGQWIICDLKKDTIVTN